MLISCQVQFKLYKVHICPRFQKHLVINKCTAARTLQNSVTIVSVPTQLGYTDVTPPTTLYTLYKHTRRLN